jgi:hypothetical protein
LNLRQRIWLELIKDDDIGINYLIGMANIILDALGRKKHCNATLAIEMRPKLNQEFGYLNLAILNEAAMAIDMEPTLKAEIRKAHLEDEKLKEI